MTDDRDDDPDTTEEKMHQCDLCYGNGFISVTGTTPCPRCWGAGEVTADQLDSPPGD
jgi:DnaJ-class molecular chaperone